MSSPLPTWQNREAMEDLVREVAGRSDVNVAVSVVGARPRVPLVGDGMTSTGTPDLDAWASCLALGDFQGTLLRAA